MPYSRIETTTQKTLPVHPRFEPSPQPNSGNRSSMSSTSTTQRRSAIPRPITSVVEPTPMRPREPNSDHPRHDLTIFRDMNRAGVSGGLFVNTSSPVNVQYIGSEFVPSVRPLGDHVVGATGSSENVQPTNASNGSHINITPEPSLTAPYDIYYRHLLGVGRGVPLWEPGLDMSLPVDYRQEGISIGDVGIVYRAGYFDFLFNIFLPADHDINLGRVPSGFVPLDRSKLEKAIRKSVPYDERGACLASSSVERTDSSEFAFETTGRDGAVLVMPDGALAEDLNKFKLVNQYIAENAKCWYDYVKSDECGVQAENGDIRVVVGMDKVSSWGMVAFKSTNAAQPPRRFEFKDDGRGGSNGKTYKWDGIVAGRAGPSEAEIRDLVRTDDNTSPLRNQCVFVRTLNISVSGKVHNELAVHEIRAGRLGDCIPDERWPQTQPHGQQNVNIQTPQVGLPVSNPSKPLHKYLLEKCPNAQVVITTDLDWMSVITENDVTTPSFEEICSRVLASHIICEKKGVVTLKKRKIDVTGFVSDPRTVSTIERPLRGHNARDGYVVGRVFLEVPDETAPSGTLSDNSVGKRRSDESSRIDEPEPLLYSRPSCHNLSDHDGGGTNVPSVKERIIDSEGRLTFDSAAWKPGEDVHDLTTEYRTYEDSPEDDSHPSPSPPYLDARPGRSKDLSSSLKDSHSKSVESNATSSYTHRLIGTFCIAQGICTISAAIVIAALVAWAQYRTPDFSFVPSTIVSLGKDNPIGSIIPLSRGDSISMMCTGKENSIGSITCLTRGDLLGLTLSVAAGLTSLISILFVLLLIALNTMRHFTNSRDRVFHWDMDILMVSLLFSDALQAIGGLQGLTWVRDGGMDIQSISNAQGIIQQIGEAAVNISNMAITIHILGVQLRGVLSRRFPFSLVTAIHTSICVLIPVVMVGNHSSYMSPTPYWCWTNECNMGLGRIRAEYLWMWLALTISPLLYTPLYLWMDRDPGFSTNLETRAMPRQLLLFTMVYCVCTLPLGIIRFFKQKGILFPRALTFVAITLFALGGFYKVVLLLITRSSSGRFFTSKPPDHFCHGSDTTRDSGDGPDTPGLKSMAKSDGLNTTMSNL